MSNSNSNSNVPQELRNFGIRRMNIKRFRAVGDGLTNSNLPSSIGLLKDLTHLYLHDNNLTKLPESIGNLTNLRVLQLSLIHI